MNSTRHQRTHDLIRANHDKQLEERYSNDAKLGGPAVTVQIFHPPIPKPETIAPDAKLRQRVRHGSNG